MLSPISNNNRPVRIDHQGEIRALYRLIHNRIPDITGFAHSLDRLESGTPLSRLLADALTSTEFREKHPCGITSPNEVNKLFHLNFGFSPQLPVINDRMVSVPEYTARLLTLNCKRIASLSFSVELSDAFYPNDTTTYQYWIAAQEPYDYLSNTIKHHNNTVIARTYSLSIIIHASSRTVAHTILANRSMISENTEDLQWVIVGSPVICNRIREVIPSATFVYSSGRNFSDIFNRALPHCLGKFTFFYRTEYRLIPGFGRIVGDAILDRHNFDMVAILGDHDEIDTVGGRRNPTFYAGWNREAALCRPDWVQHTMLRTSLARSLGGARQRWSRHAQHDLALRLIEQADDDQVLHLPYVLYGVNTSRGATGRLTKALVRQVNREAWRKFISKRLRHRQTNCQGSSVEPGSRLIKTGLSPGLRMIYPLPRDCPKVSIIIPIKDKPELLELCINSIYRTTKYGNFEIIVVDHESINEKTLALLQTFKEKYGVFILKYKGVFNWGRVNNLAVKLATGKVLIFLNNDTEALDRDWMTEIVSQVMRPKIGVVGPQLVYRDGTIQHAGIVCGPDGSAFHRFRRVPEGEAGYRDELGVVRTVSAVTGACLAIRRDVFDEIGGIEEDGLAVTWSDVDLCFRVRERGYRVVCTPFSRVLHLELATRGPDESEEKRARADRERIFMLGRWPNLCGEDPFFSPNFALLEGNTRVAPRRRL